MQYANDRPCATTANASVWAQNLGNQRICASVEMAEAKGEDGKSGAGPTCSEPKNCVRLFGGATMRTIDVLSSRITGEVRLSNRGFDQSVRRFFGLV